MNSETAARFWRLYRKLPRQVRQAALDHGILAVAAGNARKTLTSFLSGLGFEQVEVP